MKYVEIIFEKAGGSKRINMNMYLRISTTLPSSISRSGNHIFYIPVQIQVCKSISGEKKLIIQFQVQPFAVDCERIHQLCHLLLSQQK